jgi:predicted ArsR family transcriptional regulator
MTSPENEGADPAVIQFILDEIESVPHLEALLLIRNSRPRKWTAADLSKRLYISREGIRILLDDLIRRKLLLIDSADSTYYYAASDERDQVIGLVDTTYRRQVVRVSQLIHSKPSAAVRDFARAFRFTKKDE